MISLGDSERLGGSRREARREGGEDPPLTITEEIASWSASLTFDEIPERVASRAKLQVASVLAALFAGYGHDAGQRVYRVASVNGGDGATLLPNGERTTPANAIWAHASFSVVHDFDDYLFAGHTGHSAVLGSLAFSERERASGRDLITAQTIVNELGGRLGASMLFGPQNGQMWSYIHSLGAAACGARLMGLDADGIRRAIGIAFLQPPYALSPGFFGGESKVLIASEPAAAGARAAELAREGMTAPRDPLGDGQGFLHRFAGHPLDWMFTGLGEAWVSDSLTYKIVPGCAYIDGAVDCLDEVRAAFAAKHGRPLSPEDVERVRVWGSALTVGMELLCSMYCSKEDPTTVGVNFSVPMSLALMLISGELVPEALSPWFLSAKREQLLALSSRISLEHDPALTRRLGSLEGIGIDMSAAIATFDPKDLGRLGEAMIAFSGGAARPGVGERIVPDLGGRSFEGFEMRIPGRLALETKSGEEFTAEVDVPRGAAGRPFDETSKAVRRKFLRNAGYFLGEDEATEAWNVIERLEDLGSVESLVRALTRREGQSRPHGRK